jgi:hypothetical protein
MKNRWFSIMLYILTFCLIFFITSVVIINAYYFIPYDANGIDLTRSFTVIYDVVFGIIAFIFALVMSYSFLSIFGLKKLNEVFARGRKKAVYISSVITFGLAYYLIELLVGYIVLNINDPNTFVNGSNSGSIIIASDKSFDNVHLNSTTNNTNMFIIDGEHVLNINDSNVIHYGSDTTNEIGANTIVSAKNRATLNGYRIMLTLKGTNTEAIYLNDSTLHLFNSNISIEGNNSSFVYADNSQLFINSTSISNTSKNSVILTNGSSGYFDKCNFILTKNCNNVFLLNSNNKELTNEVTLKNSSIDKGDYNLFNVENSTNIINITESKVDWSEVEKYIANIKNSDVVINISNSMVTGNIYFDDASSLRINLEKAQFSGNIVSNKGFELTMDDNSLFTSPGSIHLSKFNGSDIAYRKVISIQNQIENDTEI